MNPRDGRAVNQEGWKRTQVRMPQEQYKVIMDYAEQNNLSLNTAMLELMDKGLKLPTGIDLSKEAMIVDDQAIEKIAYKLAERLNQK